MPEDRLLSNPWVKKLVKGGMIVGASYVLVGVANSLISMGVVGWLFLGLFSVGVGYVVEMLGKAGSEE